MSTAFLPGDPPRPCPEILTEEEAIAYLRLPDMGVKNPKHSMYRWRHMGMLVGIKYSKEIVYRRSDLDAFVERYQRENPR